MAASSSASSAARPDVGDSVDFDGMRFDVVEVEGSRIHKLAVTFVERPQRPTEDEEEVAAEG